MTKRDVAVWFCKVVALGGMLNAAFNLLGDLIGWKFFGTGSSFWAVPALGFFGFVWLFARGTGIELAAEGEHGEPMTSVADLGALSLRCVGLSIFLSGSVMFGSLCFAAAFEYFSSRTMTSFWGFYWPSMMSGFLQATLGFLLAFGPRLRAALQSK